MVSRQEQALDSIARSLQNVSRDLTELTRIVKKVLEQEIDVDKLQRNVGKLKTQVDSLVQVEKNLDDLTDVRLIPKDWEGVKVRVEADQLSLCNGWTGRVEEVLGRNTIGVRFPNVDGLIYFNHRDVRMVPEDQAPTDDLLTEGPREVLKRYESGIPEVGSVRRPTIGDSIKSHGWGGRPPTDEEIDKPVNPEAMKALSDHLDRTDPKDDSRD